MIGWITHSEENDFFFVPISPYLAVLFLWTYDMGQNKKYNTSIWQGHIILIKNDSKDLFYQIQINDLLNFIFQRILQKCITFHIK